MVQYASSGRGGELVGVCMRVPECEDGRVSSLLGISFVPPVDVTYCLA